MSREHNDANVLSLGGRIVAPALADEILRLWLATPFEGGRHQRRLDQITEIERRADMHLAHARTLRRRRRLGGLPERPRGDRRRRAARSPSAIRAELADQRSRSS